jgi:surface antigen
MTALRKFILTACISLFAVTTAIGVAAAGPHHRSVKPTASKAVANGKAKFISPGIRHAPRSAAAKRENANPGLNCVQFVKAVSDIALTGDAWMWWHRAEGVYGRGSEPRKDAILVFKQSGKMTRGHVAQVTAVIDSRNIRIDHSNWAPRSGLKGRVDRDVIVQDISDTNNWSLVRVWYDKVDQFGRPYPTFGFVYSPEAPIQSASAENNDVLLHRASFGIPDSRAGAVTSGVQALPASAMYPDPQHEESAAGSSKARSADAYSSIHSMGVGTQKGTQRRHPTR